ncbi:hypothetical protein KC573_00775 [candidate division WWE3 bacterium]|uniref:Uncharacterized protein n=1 Tax=candidate division WWE3 bacterium TaxID=2053526 RepID=A0A955LVC1_UNCKA|nr:hypothetical protein [candidate division WWE3 bacterium]
MLNLSDTIEYCLRLWASGLIRNKRHLRVYCLAVSRNQLTSVLAENSVALQIGW